MIKRVKKLLALSLSLAFFSMAYVSFAYVPLVFAASSPGSAGIIWSEAQIATYTVTYRGGEGSTGIEPIDPHSPYFVGSGVTVLGQGALRHIAGFSFEGWTYGSAESTFFADGTTPIGNGAFIGVGVSFIMPAANVTLTARWVEPSTPERIQFYTVEFDRNDGEVTSRESIGGIPESGNLRSIGRQVPVISRTGYTFRSWNTRADGGGAVFTNTTIVSNAVSAGTTLVVYAQWVEDATDAEPPQIPPPPEPPPDTPLPPPTTPAPPSPLSPPSPTTPVPTPTPPLAVTPTPESAPVTPAPTLEPPTAPEIPTAPTIDPVFPTSAPPALTADAPDTSEIPPNQEIYVPEADSPLVGPEIMVPGQAVPLIGRNNIPLFASVGSDSWALMNLILGAISLALSIFVTIRAMTQKRCAQKETRNGVCTPYHEYVKMSRLVFLAVTIVAGIVHAALFLLTQDISKTMVLLDVWTMVHAVILVTEIMAIVFMRREKCFQPVNA